MFLFLFLHFSSYADIVDSPGVTLACTDNNYDLLLSETNYVYAFLAANLKAEGGEEQVQVKIKY